MPMGCMLIKKLEAPFVRVECWQGSKYIRVNKYKMCTNEQIITAGNIMLVTHINKAKEHTL